MPFLEGATNRGRKAMPCWECDHCDEDRFCDVVGRRIVKRPFRCAHYIPKEGS